MKKIALAIAFLFAVSAAVFAQTKSASAKAPAFKWEKTTHDFAAIPQGKPVTAEFKFTNSGSAPLIISAAQGSCGCTVPEYSKEPIAPGKTGVVKATFNAAAVGPFTKTVTLTTNVGTAPVTLTIKGEVKSNTTPAN
ncbi:DUF1573 domain-containing protein [Xanthocytophaga agilis]|uniref:DUF1573 domain-containing protein n=1 Tax=Xanthocytophaga agilis TaxID=3048010 RepID=A0AAE3R5J8_9BACT|nr:DUF1573 domain-containing protein [Xanthocytophaga agilis]MDJ1501790.1 DUF1573 domain-containing protein [Xanthocytophaga agilis]